MAAGKEEIRKAPSLGRAAFGTLGHLDILTITVHRVYHLEWEPQDFGCMDFNGHLLLLLPRIAPSCNRKGNSWHSRTGF